MSKMQIFSVLDIKNFGKEYMEVCCFVIFSVVLKNTIGTYYIM